MSNITMWKCPVCGTEQDIEKNIENPECNNCKYTKLRDFILEKEKEGKVVIQTVEGFAEIKLDDIIKQPAEGLLYDLNRDRLTVLTFIDDPKWVNDYAVGLVITKLKKLLDEK